MPPTRISVEFSQWVHYKPMLLISDNAPIELVMPGVGDEYIDLSQILINLKVKTVNQDGSALTAVKLWDL